MGAAVSLYNRYDELVRRALSNQDGKFVFDTLSPDVYSIRVSLASFVPALRRNIPVLAGSENLLKIQLASALSSIELVPLTAPEGAQAVSVSEASWNEEDAFDLCHRVNNGEAVVSIAAADGGKIFLTRCRIQAATLDQAG